MQNFERDKFLVETMGWRHWNSIGDRHTYLNHDESHVFSDPKQLPDFSTWEGFGILFTWFKEQNPLVRGAVLKQHKPSFEIGLDTLSPAYQSLFIKDIDPDKFANAMYNTFKNPEFDFEGLKTKWEEMLKK